MTIDNLHLQVLRTHQTYPELLARAAVETGHSEAEANAALRQYEDFGALPAWALDYFDGRNQPNTAARA